MKSRAEKDQADRVVEMIGRVKGMYIALSAAYVWQFYGVRGQEKARSCEPVWQYGSEKQVDTGEMVLLVRFPFL